MSWLRDLFKTTKRAKCTHEDAGYYWLCQGVCIVKCPKCGWEKEFSSPSQFFDKQKNNESKPV